jgi:4,5-DOPA dioxygenase extradiol
MPESVARMPVVFIGHGSPMNTLADNRYTRVWRMLGASLPRPRAVLAVSAHWYVGGTAITAMARPKTIHDFYGFPPELFAYQYPAPGDPALAAQVRTLLAGIDVELDQSWGLDHGTWSVLAHVYPGADIPVVQLSMDGTKPAAFHFETGRRLGVLRDQGVLILASGNVVHNLSLMKWREDAAAYEWATAFNDTVRERLLERDHESVVNPMKSGEAARLSIPTPEHYLPLIYALGAAGADDPVEVLTDGIELASTACCRSCSARTRRAEVQISLLRAKRAM